MTKSKSGESGGQGAKSGEQKLICHKFGFKTSYT
jgi:hypothetical protein